MRNGNCRRLKKEIQPKRLKTGKCMLEKYKKLLSLKVNPKNQKKNQNQLSLKKRKQRQSGGKMAKKNKTDAKRGDLVPKRGGSPSKEVSYQYASQYTQEAFDKAVFLMRKS